MNGTHTIGSRSNSDGVTMPRICVDREGNRAEPDEVVGSICTAVLKTHSEEVALPQPGLVSAP
jgi:hypothetical protein